MPGYSNWRTPDEVYRLLDEEFHFTLDACASHANAKTPRYCTEDGTYAKTPQGPAYVRGAHGLTPSSWADQRVFCNPPYTAAALRQAVYCANLGWAEKSVLLLPPHLDAEWARSLWPLEMGYGIDAVVSRHEKWLSISVPAARWELRIWNGRIRFGVPKTRRLENDGDGGIRTVYDETDPETESGDAPRAGNMIAIWHG